MRPIISPSSYKPKDKVDTEQRKSWDASCDDFLPSCSPYHGYGTGSPRKSGTGRPKWGKPLTEEDNTKPGDWLGASPDKKKRSWRVKEIRPLIDAPDLDC